MFDDIAAWSRTIHPILQGAIGSAAFAVSLAAGRLLYRLASSAIRRWRKKREFDEITRIVIHKYYVNRNGLYYFPLGYLFILAFSLRPFIQGVLVFVASWGVSQLLSSVSLRQVIAYGGAYVAVQFLINALSWLNPRLSKRDLDSYDKELVQLVVNSLVEEPEKDLRPPKPRRSTPIDKSVADTKRKMEELERRIYSTRKRAVR